MLYSWMFCVALSMGLFVLCVASLTVFGYVCYFVVECDGVVLTTSATSSSSITIT